MTASHLHETLSRLSSRAASSVVARGRIASPALNAALLRRLSASPGQPDALLADPVFEAAPDWEAADCTLDQLGGGLLHPDLVAALDGAAEERMPRDRRPWSHQLAAWEAARDGLSCVVSSGTGSGKTECFMIPMLDDLLRENAAGLSVGVRAIVIYPLNALIESQRERLAAWTAPIKDRVRFALYNGLTPETKRQEDSARLGPAEIGNRREIRGTPPAVLVTNITMLEYLLLRSKDRPILERSQGLLRWIVLDEAHSYIGAQAAEMALLLRRVRAAFGVEPDQVRLMAASATIGGGTDADGELRRFAADLAGVREDRVRVIQGRKVESQLPATAADAAFEPSTYSRLSSEELWGILATHPRVQNLKAAISEEGATLSQVAGILFDSSRAADFKRDAQTVLDAAARARCPRTGERLLAWRAHLFHRSLGGIWACVDPGCGYRDPELGMKDVDWQFGAVWLKQRDRCKCGAPVFELLACNECGNPGLEVGLWNGAQTRLVPIQPEQVDEFAIDAEPGDLDDAEGVASCRPHDISVHGTGMIYPPSGTGSDSYLRLQDGVVFDNNLPPEGRCVRISIEFQERVSACCPGSFNARLTPQRYGPPFFMGVAMPSLIESLASPMEESGRPMGGRRGLTFSDSRQGTARLAAKLQQDAERNLTRAFLYHSVQGAVVLDHAERKNLEEQRKKLLAVNEPALSSLLQGIEEKLGEEAKPIPWLTLVEGFAQQRELGEFATDVWQDRAGGGRELAQDPLKLSEMFLYRELLRRPKVQNNAETMGLVRLSFPGLEHKALLTMPSELVEAGADNETWLGLALAAIDFVFREALAVNLSSENRLMPFVSPRTGRQTGSICRPGLAVPDRPRNSRPWPSPVPATSRPSRLHRLLYSLIDGDPENKSDQDRAGAVLSELWELLVSTVAKDSGRGAYQLEYGKAAATRLERGWLCPVTRRIFGYSPGGRSPYDPSRMLLPVDLPRLPSSNAGGLDPDIRSEMARWCETDDHVAGLRRDGIWTDLHDRAAVYAPFLRSQEHSAQIERPVLADYERLFKDGQINLLNCSTTMEMGIDIPDVRLVANGNTPPSISNYRQRLGRAGRRGEPWAFGLTFCRDLPLDRIVFENPGRFLKTLVTAPAVRLDSPSLVGRHVHAALLGAFLRDLLEGFEILSSTGDFFGASEEAEKPADGSMAEADKFLSDLRGEWSCSKRLRADLRNLTKGTVFGAKTADYLAGMTAESFERVLLRWRREYAEILSRRDAATEPEVRQAFDMRARRMRGEFLLAELARRGFTPSYGFPVDVVSFDHLSGREGDQESRGENIVFGDRRGGASRTLDIAIREYAPGSEIVVDGLVHRSEGVLPAWRALADASQLEDLQYFWECRSCRAFGVARLEPEVCPECHAQSPRWQRGLRPAGFLGRRAPHTGYENLGHSPYELPRLSASKGIWRALPHPEAGRYRADTRGQIVTRGSGPHGEGYALCLDCGRAEAEEGYDAPMPQAIRQHRPLAKARGMSLKGGYCSGGFAKLERIQRNVRFIHETNTDVFELQLPPGSSREESLALAAGLREALAARLGAEVREIGVSIDDSKGPANEKRLSAFLYDRASGGAGFSSRLVEAGWFKECLNDAVQRLSCDEECAHGCPACVLRPDLNLGEVRIDRIGGLELGEKLLGFLDIPERLRAFGHDTRLINNTLGEWIDQQRQRRSLITVRLYLHGYPGEWELASWRVEQILRRLKEARMQAEIVLQAETLTDKELSIAHKLDLHRLSSHACLNLAAELPVERGMYVLASVHDKDGVVALATSSEKEALPGPHWGLGEEAPLVLGEAGTLPTVEKFDSRELVSISSGNARLIKVGARLDGAVKDFGRAFWKLLGAQDPITIASMKTHGVVDVCYTDRYLLTPLALRLLFEVMNRMPGRREKKLTLYTGRSGEREPPEWSMFRTVFHNFREDAARRSVMQALLPDADIHMRDKRDLPHERSLRIDLGDGRRVELLFDQGFGAWRAVGSPGYDFSTTPAKQARSLKTANFAIGVEAGREVPLVLQVDQM